MRLAWCSDIHLDHLDEIDRKYFLKLLNDKNHDLVVISGDITVFRHLSSCLEAFNQLNKPIAFVLGNHDFYGGSIVDGRTIAGLDRANVTYLSKTPNGIKLSEDVVLIGHDGWYDCRSGTVDGSVILNDFHMISDFKIADGLWTALDSPRDLMYVKFRGLADESVSFLKTSILQAFASYRKIVIATHVPPPEFSMYNNKQSEPSYLPYFSSTALSRMLIEVAESNKDKSITVLCGHTHGLACGFLADNVEIMVAGATYGYPEIQEVLEF